MSLVAGYGMVLCGHRDQFAHRYRGHRIEKVKFGVPISEAFSHDIPATLLVLLLKVNKEGPIKKDIWRAPGNQAHVRKLAHIMQNGRLVNISNFSVYTAASVIKKFLSKLPGGIFGAENERILLNAVVHNSDDDEKMRNIFYRLFCSLPVPSQHLLVLLFGTFRGISDASGDFGTKMSSDAIGISVAPSLFHSCIHDGNKVKVEDVQRFKLASQVVSLIITSFGHTNLFPRECYEFYARITGRTLRVDENWLFRFEMPAKKKPPSTFSVMAAQVAGFSLSTLHITPPVVSSLESGRERKGMTRTASLKCPSTEATLDRTRTSLRGDIIDDIEMREKCNSQPLLETIPSYPLGSSRLSKSAGQEVGVCELSNTSSRHSRAFEYPSIDQRQLERMKCRSEWFLSPLRDASNVSESERRRRSSSGISERLSSYGDHYV